jgi:hypothetical protein
MFHTQTGIWAGRLEEWRVLSLCLETREDVFLTMSINLS